MQSSLRYERELQLSSNKEKKESTNLSANKLFVPFLGKQIKPF